MADNNREFYSGGAIAKRPWNYLGGEMHHRHIGIDRYAAARAGFIYTFPFRFDQES